METYVIQYQLMYEPYVVGSRLAIHLFDERLRGFGFNKRSWLTKAYLRGFRFQVLCGAFVVHMNHPNRRGRVIGNQAQEVAEWYKEHYWPERYNFSLSGRGLHSHKVMCVRNEYRELRKQFAAAKPRYLDCQEEFGTTKEDAARVRQRHISNWIDVIKYAEKVEGWKTSFEELLQLAKVLNAILVEPCMHNGRLISCAKQGVPLSDILDLTDEMAPATRPLVAAYGEYQELVRDGEPDFDFDFSLFTLRST